jgi:hypothetical protein
VSSIFCVVLSCAGGGFDPPSKKSISRFIVLEVNSVSHQSRGPDPWNGQVPSCTESRRMRK